MNERTNSWFALPSELNAAGILGINRRNLDYILAYNPRGLYPRVDNKLITKQICEASGIPIPQTYQVLGSQSDVKRFIREIGEMKDFVAKPACGAGGRGIAVIADRHDEHFITPGGRKIHWTELRYHMSTIVSGLYSLGGQMDSVIVEQRIVNHPALHKVAVGGTPDIRVILFRGVPVMAMVRLPTNASGGRANLHQGAIAAAVDLASGQTYGGVCKNRSIDRHPDTGEQIGGLAIPGWQDVLQGAMRLGDALELGYVGVDFVLDATIGPVVLEANARPGLAIQVAHRFGIRKRLDRVERARPEELRGEARWRLMRELVAL